MPTFPLSIAANGRHLVTADGVPFFMHADTPWSIMIQLTASEVDTYIAHLISKGFNTVLVNLIETGFGDNPPNNQNGDGPFTVAGDYTTPRAAYFNFCDTVLTKLLNAGILVVLTPSYVGANGGAEGWMTQMRTNTEAELISYGEYLGNRYASYPNIVWLHAGDYNVPVESDKVLVRAIKTGLKNTDVAGRLHSAHCARGNSAYDHFNEAWLDLNNSYIAGGATYSTMTGDFDEVAKPCFMIEGYYENENSITAQGLRRQSYWSLLTGMCGQFYGNNPVWFLGNGWDGASGINSTPYQHQRNFRRVVDHVPWWRFVQDTDHRLVTSASKGTSGTTDYLVAARDTDRRCGLVYVPSAVNAPTVNLGQLTGLISAQWYDPTNGRFTKIGNYSARGQQSFAHPGANAAGDNDWVLMLTSQQGGGGSVVF